MHHPHPREPRARLASLALGLGAAAALSAAVIAARSAGGAAASPPASPPAPATHPPAKSVAPQAPKAPPGQVWPKPTVPSLDGRAALIERRLSARAAGDLVGEATANAELAADAIARAMAVHDAWMFRRHPETKLFPQSPERAEFTYRNVGADFFCFQLLIAMYTGRDTIGALKESLASERALCGPGALCGAIDWKTGERLPRSFNARVFSTSEYIKDGLISLYDREGDADVMARMVELADAIVRSSREKSRFGPIPSRDSEVNGDVLQALSRLAFAADNPKYADLAGRLGDAVVGQMLRHTGGVPVKRYNYASDTHPRDVVQIRDHGNETAVGLSEVYALAVAKSAEPIWARRAGRWAAPIAKMYRTILTKGVNKDGLLVNQIDDRTLEPIDSGACDNWGYMFSGAILFTQAAEQHGKVPEWQIESILAAVDRISLAVTKTDNLPWEGTHQDGFADTIESAIYVAAQRPGIRRQLLDWCDTQITHLFRFQRPDGFVSDDYLDGNFIRTAMLYAEMRSGGFRLYPWKAGAGVGLAGAEGAEPVLVVRAGPDGFRGRLLADHRRHRDYMRLPWDWPLLNSWPEWAGTDEPVPPATGDKAKADDGATQPGIAIELKPNEVRVLRLSDVNAEAWRVP